MYGGAERGLVCINKFSRDDYIILKILLHVHVLLLYAMKEVFKKDASTVLAKQRKLPKYYYLLRKLFFNLLRVMNFIYVLQLKKLSSYLQ